MFNIHDTKRNHCQLFGAQSRLGYDWWWHSFSGRDAETGEDAAQLHRFWGWDCIEVEMNGPLRWLQLFEMFWHVEQRTWLDRIRAENIGCEYGEYDTERPY